MGALIPLPSEEICRVLPARAGGGKEFDYAAPEGAVHVGTEVRVDLHGRRVGGWVVAVGVTPPEGTAVRRIAKVRGAGPEPSVVELSAWAAWRWAGRRDHVLATASSPVAAPVLPPPRLRPPAPPTGPAPPIDGAEGPVVLRIPPAADATPLIAHMAQRGPVLVVVPSVARAQVLGARLRRAGGDVAVLPEGWSQARAGAAVVIGARAAAWGPCLDVAGIVVVDAHDESLTQEQAPTWNASAVAVERARRAGVPCVLVTPCPTLDLLELGQLRRVEPSAERSGWAPFEIVDRRGDDPRSGLYSERLVAFVRANRRVVCVLNRTGRARLLACQACGEIARCERCGSPLGQAGGDAREVLTCGRCGSERPAFCTRCGSTRLRLLRVGVARAREELEALAGRPVGEVQASTEGVPPVDVLVGTEAVLHRLSRADGFGAVAFLDFDQELLAQRVRAGEEALSLLALASRLVGGRKGRVLVQTRLPSHPVIRAAVLADPGVLAEDEVPARRELGLPPFTATALVSGPGAAGFVEALAPTGVTLMGPDGDRWLVKAADHEALADALAATPRGAERLRIEVDPARV